MFCSKCGKTLLDGDRFCSYCGAPVIERQEQARTYAGGEIHKEIIAADCQKGRRSVTDGIEEVIYNHHTEERPDQPARETLELSKKTIAETWQAISQRGGERTGSIPWNLEGFPLQGGGTRKKEDFRVDWSKRQLLKFGSEAEGNTLEELPPSPPAKKPDLLMPADPPARPAGPEKREEAPEPLKEANKPDIFDLFDQQLQEELHQEKDPQDTLIFYRKGAPEKNEQEEAAPADKPDKDESPVSPLEQELFPPKSSVSHTPVEEEINKFYTFSQKNEEFQKLLDKEYERLKRIPDVPGRDFSQMASNLQKLELDWKAEPPVGLISDTLGAIPALNPEGLGPVPAEPKAGEEEVNPSLQKEPEGQKEEGPPERESKRSEQEAGLKPRKEQRQEEPEIIEGPPKEEKEPMKPLQEEASGDSEVIQEDVHAPLFAEDSEAPFPQPLPWDNQESLVGEFVDEARGKKLSPAVLLLAVIIALLAFEVIVLGIKYFAPESAAAAFIHDRLGVAVNWVDNLKPDSDQEKKDPQKQDETDKEAPDQTVNSAQPDPSPNKDKDALVAEALGYNNNIQYIGADNTLAYQENKNYGNENINNSKPIENNIWYEDENGSPVYYDKEIVKTIIQFDSAWIDYVNKKDQSVFNLIKEGSSAYKNAKTSSLVGKVTETFDVLRIGEIRQSETGFYLWVYEEMTIDKAGKTQTKQYNYIYYLEPVEKQMKIVSYTTF